jgi:hypothetical protein
MNAQPRIPGVEPLVEAIENGERPLAAGFAAFRRRLPEPPLGPQLFPPLEKSDDQFVLGREIAVKGHLRDAHLRDHGLYRPPGSRHG